MAACAAGGAGAQGSLASQGFGYPPGALSTHALSLGGGTAEVDATSPINPSALAAWGPSGLYFQYSPEYRLVSVAGKNEHTTTVRFPLVAAAFSAKQRFMVGVSASTLLDRTWETTISAQQNIGGNVVPFTETFRVTGAINDVRLGGAWAVSRRFALGVAGHLLVGENRADVRRSFPDSVRFDTLNTSSTIGYAGAAISAGAMWSPVRALTLGASVQRGAGVHAKLGDSVLARANAPDRYGAGLRYDGLAGITLAASAERIAWSRMSGLGSANASGVDGWDVGAGVEAPGPRFGSSTVALRAGVRRRALPFRADSAVVHETGVSAGLGVPVAAGRALVDAALQYAARTAAVTDVREHAWIISIGLAVRP